jgi:hypothetical protein
MDRAEKHLRIYMRIVGTSMVAAVVGVLIPLEWMDAVHRKLDQGPLPQGPIVDYMARSLSLFYVIEGGLCWLVSFSLRRHLTIVTYLGVTGTLGAIALGVIDLRAGLPTHWAVSEMTVPTLMSLVMLWLRSRVRANP